MSALRGLRGRATLGDVVSATGMPDHEAEAALKSLLETHRGHLEVADSGDLLYQFDPRLIERDAEPFWTRLRRGAWSAFKVGFKVWTAASCWSCTSPSSWCCCSPSCCAAPTTAASAGGAGSAWATSSFCTGCWGAAGGTAGGSTTATRTPGALPKNARPPFYKKVFAFIFGPEEPRPTQLQKDRTVLQLIRARKGVLTSSELIAHTGLTVEDADEEMARLTGAYGGDPRVSDAGEVVYAFPELMKSAHGKVRAREPKPAWMRLEYPRKLTGNSAGSNWGIGLMNGFNLTMATLMGLVPGFAAAGQGLPPLDPLIFYGLGVVPFTFSGLFYAIPLVRSFGLGGQNRSRLQRNVRRLLLGLVYSRSVGTVREVAVADAIRHVNRALKGQQVPPKTILRELERLAAEFDAEVEAEDEGFRYRFPAIRHTFVEAELMRRLLKLEDQRLGPVVYATSDTAAQATDRDLEAFDRELKGAELDLSGYLASPTRVGYEEDFEVVMDPARASPARTRTQSRRPPRRSPPQWR